jgi:hypothetical protein
MYLPYLGEARIDRGNNDKLQEYFTINALALN